MDPKKLEQSVVATEPASEGDIQRNRNSAASPAPRDSPPSEASGSASSRPGHVSESSLETPSNSCVAHETSAEDCPRNRFIVWAAVKRNKSTRMPRSARLSCPLLRCGEQFEDHEHMLRHLSECQHLTAGEYMCYECMEVERFNDAKCTCCKVPTTKRRRIINKAKNFFSNIGQRSRREGGSPVNRDETTIPPPSYESLQIPTTQEQQQQTRQQQQRQTAPPRQPQIELNGTEILELDSHQLVPTCQLDAMNYDFEPSIDMDLDVDMNMDANIGMDAGMGLEETEYSSPLNASTQTQTEPPCLSDGQPTPRDEPLPGTSTSQGPMRPPNRPALALNTHMDQYRSIHYNKYLSPDSSVRSKRSSNGVSPLTAWSAGSGQSETWTMATSLDTALTSPGDPFDMYGQNSVSFPLLTEQSLKRRKFGESHGKGQNDTVEDGRQELPGDNPLSIALASKPTDDPGLFSFDRNDEFSWLSGVNTELSLGTSVNMMFTAGENQHHQISGLEFQGGTDLDARGLVESFWEALREHLYSSFAKLSQIQGNPLADELQKHSVGSVAHRGLDSLRNILDGEDPTEPLNYLCFVHTVYAMGIVMYDSEVLAPRCDRLFKQAVAYRGFLDPSYFEMYTQITTMLWKPAQDPNIQERSSGRHSRSKGKEAEYRYNSATSISTDPCVVIGQNFLDDIENYVVNSGQSTRPLEVLTSALWSTHVSEMRPMSPDAEGFVAAVQYIVHNLIGQFQSNTLASKLKWTLQRVQNRYITTIRRFELEILQAGKGTWLAQPQRDYIRALLRDPWIRGLISRPILRQIPSCLSLTEMFTSFSPKVRELCGPVFSHGMNSRTRYQSLGVSLVESLIQRFEEEQAPNMKGGHAPSHETGDMPLNLPASFGDFDNIIQLVNQNYSEQGSMNQNMFAPMNSGHSQHGDVFQHQQHRHYHGQQIPSTPSMHSNMIGASGFPHMGSNASMSGPSSLEDTTGAYQNRASSRSTTDSFVPSAMPSPDLLGGTQQQAGTNNPLGGSSRRSTPSIPQRGSSSYVADLPASRNAESIAAAANHPAPSLHHPLPQPTPVPSTPSLSGQVSRGQNQFMIHQEASTKTSTSDMIGSASTHSSSSTARGVASHAHPQQQSLPGTSVGAALEENSDNSSTSAQQKTEALESCHLCGYRPKGDPRWFQGSMAKHRKTQHATGPPKIYRCPYPGCKSAYKNRQDNLRQHQLEKGHFVGGGPGTDEGGGSSSKNSGKGGRKKTTGSGKNKQEGEGKGKGGAQDKGGSDEGREPEEVFNDNNNWAVGATGTTTTATAMTEGVGGVEGERWMVASFSSPPMVRKRKQLWEDEEGDGEYEDDADAEGGSG